MLLPRAFLVVLPASALQDDRRTAPAILAPAGWALVIGVHRVDGRSHGTASQVEDERVGYLHHLGVRHPVDTTLFIHAVRTAADVMDAALRSGQRRVISFRGQNLPMRADRPGSAAIVAGRLGTAGAVAPLDAIVVDTLGLANPLGARISRTLPGQTGHEWGRPGSALVLGAPVAWHAMLRRMARAGTLAMFALPLGAMFCGDSAPPCVPTATAAQLGAAPCDAAPCVDLFVVAHEDDDLLFMNPEILGSIRRGDRVVALYITAGELGQRGIDQYWIDRERGSLDAYAFMAGAATLDAYTPPPAVPGGWRATTITLGGIVATDYELDTAPISLVFLHLGDFQEQCLWDQTTGCSSDNPGGGTLPYLAITKRCAGDGISPACATPTTLPVQHVTRDALVAALAAAISHFDVDSIDALDDTHLHFDVLGGATRAGWTEYPDHYYSALFATAAVATAQPGSPRMLALGLHRGYTISRAPVNLAPGAACLKGSAFARYAMFDDKIVRHPTPAGFPGCLDCDVAGEYRLEDPASWQRRMYATRTLGSTSGALAVAGVCLGARGDVVTRVPCAGAPTWSTTGRNQLALGDRCLTAASGAVALAPCDATRADQVMLVFDDSQIRPDDAGCLTWTGGQLTDAPCTADVGADGHVTDRAPASQAFALGAP